MMISLVQKDVPMRDKKFQVICRHESNCAVLPSWFEARWYTGIKATPMVTDAVGLTILCEFLCR